MDKKAVLVSVDSNGTVSKKITLEFLFEYQKAVLLDLAEQGVINSVQCNMCIDRLSAQLRLQAANPHLGAH